MSAYWPHWSRPWWLLLLPLAAGLLWLLWRAVRHSSTWQALLPIPLQAALLRGGERGTNRLPWIGLGLAWLLAVLALAGPSWRQLQAPLAPTAEPLVVVLDLSPDMLTNDLAPNRLAHARHKLIDLFDQRRHSYTGIVVYAGSPHTLVPLTDDRATLSNLLNAVSPQIMPQPGQRADLALSHGLDLLSQGNAGPGRVLLMTGALSEQERQGIRQALKHRPTHLDILGFGTAQGGPATRADGTLARNPGGGISLSRLDEAGLRGFAKSLGGGYANAAVSDADLKALGLFETGKSQPKAQNRPLERWYEQGHWLLLPLLLIVALSARRGWLLCLPLLLLSWPQPGLTMDWQSLWRRPDQQGQQLLQQARPKEAAERFQDHRWQGVALYRAGDYGAAAEQFATGNQAADHYNEGNALALAGHLEDALLAYQQALQMDPKLSAARHNQALIERLLQQQQQQNQQGGNPQPGDKGNGQGSDGQSSANQGSQGQRSDGQAGSQPGQSDSADQAPPPSAGDDMTGNGTPPPKPGKSPSPEPAESGKNNGSPGQDNGKPEADAQDAETDQSAVTQADTAASQAPGAPGPSDTESDAGRQAGERQQATEQWLRQIPDNPAELLRRKFRYEQQLRRQRSLP